MAAAPLATDKHCPSLLAPCVTAWLCPRASDTPCCAATDGLAARQVRSVYVAFYRESWVAGAPLESAASLTATLHLDVAPRSGEAPLTRAEVLALGVDQRAMRLLVELAPALAIPAFGLAILTEDASFAATLTSMQVSAHARSLRTNAHPPYPRTADAVMPRDRLTHGDELSATHHRLAPMEMTTATATPARRSSRASRLSRQVVCATISTGLSAARSSGTWPPTLRSASRSRS